MKKKKKKLISLAEKVRRDNEIKETGKLVSLRPSITHKSKKKIIHVSGNSKIMNNRKELIELNKLYRKRLVDSVITKLLKVLEFTGLDTLEDLVFDYKSLESKSISGNIQKLYYVNKTFNYIKVDMDYGEYSKHNLDIEDLDTTDLEIIVFNNIIGYYKENKLIKIAKDYED